MRKGMVGGPAIAVLVLIGSISLFFMIEPHKNIKLEKIKLEKKEIKINENIKSNINR